MSSTEIRGHPFPTAVKEQALQLLCVARTGFASTDKPKILARDPVAMESLGAAIHHVAGLGDKLLCSVGGLRAALIAVRQAVLLADGRLPLDWLSCREYSDL